MEPVLTIRQPWASAIFRAGKDVENRRRLTHYRGRLWIHAARCRRRDEADQWADHSGLWLPGEPLMRGVILGCVDLVDWVQDSRSPWALVGHYHWLLRRPMLLARPIPAPGNLSFAWRRPPRAAGAGAAIAGELRGSELGVSLKCCAVVRRRRRRAVEVEYPAQVAARCTQRSPARTNRPQLISSFE